MDPELVEQLAAKSRAHHLDAGKWLFRERDPGHEMYVVRAGRLEAVDEGAGAVLREYRRGDALGEVALLTDSPRAASVRAARGTEVIAVDQADFTNLLHSSPAASLALNRSLSRRLQDTRAGASSARPRPTTVALIALDWRIPMERLAARLGAALGAHLLLGSENTAQAARCHADLVIKPNAAGVGLLEFDQLDTAREAGRRAAREALELAPACLVA